MVRSRYNVVFTEVPKKDGIYADHTRVHASGESGYASASGKYVAVHLAKAGGQCSIYDIHKPKRCGRDDPTLNVHKGKVLCSQWTPFNQSMIATGADDALIKLSVIPEGFCDQKESVNECLQTMKGHTKKVLLIDFNKVATNILASVGQDKVCKLWDVESGSSVSEFALPSGTTHNFTGIKWAYDGSRLATTSKDGILRLWDPRTPASEVTCVTGLAEKATNKPFWCGKLPYVGTVGQDKTRKRVLNLWDVNKLDSPVQSMKPGSTSSSPSVAIPYYDEDMNILYYFGKGQSTVWFGEIMDDASVVPAGVGRLQTPMKGGCFMPKHAVNTWMGGSGGNGGCEVARFMKIEANAIVPHSFVFPKRTEVYHADVYPDTFQGNFALTKDDWLAGQNAMPVIGSMDPEQRSQGDSAGMVFEKKASYAELEQENADLKARVAELEAMVAQMQQ